MKYRPLLRLIATEDEKYVTDSLGPEVGKAYRNIRKTIVRDYLRSLSADFNRIHQIATSMALRAPDDAAAYSVTLLEQKMSFIFNIWTIELNLALGGVVATKTRLEPVLAYLETLADQTRELTRPQLNYRVM